MSLKILLNSKFRSWKGEILNAFIPGCGNGVQASITEPQQLVKDVLRSLYAYQMVVVYNIYI